MQSEALINLAALFIAVVGLSWLTTRLIGQGVWRSQRGRRLQVVEYQPLGKDRSLALVQLGGRWFFIGAAAQRVELLAELGGDPAAEADGPAKPAVPPVTSGFGVALRAWLGRLSAAAMPGSMAAAPPPGQVQQRLDGQLQRLRQLARKT